jgi:hypothetical protein
MVASTLRIASIACTAILVLSFALFATDQSKEGSQQQVAKLEGIDDSAPSTADERLREQEHGEAREFIDDANDVLVSPFADVVESTDLWVERGVPTLLGLLLWGLGARLLAGYLPKTLK